MIFNAAFLSRIQLEKSFELVSDNWKRNITEMYEKDVEKFGEDWREDFPFQKTLDYACEAAGMPFDLGWDQIDAEMGNKCIGFTDWLKSIMIKYPGWSLDIHLNGKYLNNWPNEGDFELAYMYPSTPGTFVWDLNISALYYGAKIVTTGGLMDGDSILGTNFENIHQYEDQCREFTTMDKCEMEQLHAIQTDLGIDDFVQPKFHIMCGFIVTWSYSPSTTIGFWFD